ncbi:MAG: hypothetical protein ABF297_12590 [Thiogranum sp.]
MLIIIAVKPRVVFFMLLTYLWPVATLGNDFRDFEAKIEPVQVSGRDLASMIGVSIEDMRVYASRNNKLLPIPFQIDQKNAAGDWVWTKIPESGKRQIEIPEDEYLDLPSTRSRDLTVDDQDPPGRALFDSNDLLVFMARDVGNRYTSAPNIPGSVMVELEISDPQDGSRGWIYIVYYASNPTALAKQRYVSYQESGRRVVAPGYELVYSPKHSVMLVDLKVDGVSILERSRINGKVKAGMGPLTTTMEFDERAIDGYDAGYINGPVRVVKRSVDHVKIKAGMRSPDVNCDHYYYPWHAEVPMLFSMRFPVKGVEMLAASRYRNDVFRYARVPQTTASINIANSQHNLNLLADRKEARWLSLHGDRLTVVSRIKVPKGIGEYFSVAPYLANDSGQAVEAGYVIKTKKSIKKGEHVLHSVFLILLDSSDSNAAAKVTGFLDNKLHIEAAALQ